jgi:hypothetical protein
MVLLKEFLEPPFPTSFPHFTMWMQEGYPRSSHVCVLALSCCAHIADAVFCCTITSHVTGHSSGLVGSDST